MSNFLTGLNQLDPSVKRFNGGGSSFTLDEAGTTTATRLVVGVVEQVPGVDFNVSGTTLSTTSATPSGTNNVVSFQYFKSGTVNTATAVATNGVNNAAMADDAVGIAELSATGTASSSTFLRGDNAWAAPTGGWEFVESVTASTSSTIDLGEGNLASGYNYQIDCIQVKNSADLSVANCPRLQFGTSSGPTYQTSGYTNQMGNWAATAEDSGRDSTTAGIPIVVFGNLGGATAGETWDAVVNIPNPATSAEHRVSSWGGGINNAGDECLYFCVGHRTTAEVVTGLRILNGTGTIDSGTFVLSRRKIA